MSTDTGPGRWSMFMRKMVMFYLLFAFPLLIVYALLAFLTDLRGRMLLYCMVPVGIVLLVHFILCLVRPGMLFSFRSESESDRQSP